MACSHSGGCPLFPKLKASLRGWRDAYCDSDTEWRNCARYAQSLTGRSVPITLLPNGKYAHTMTRAGAAAAVPAALVGPAEAPPSRFASLPRVAAASPESPFEDAPEQPAPVLVRPPLPAAPPPPPAPARGGWWTRLVNWMRGPA
jgi:hypothetical protein